MHRHIHQLLLHHDCVVVPGLGGFLCQYKGAEVKYNEWSVLPPARKIAFNKALYQNDGLLIQHVALSEKLSYKAAEDKVYDYAHHCLHQLQLQGSFMLPGIGRLFNDEAGQLQFTPVSDALPLDDAFGFRPLSIQAVTRLESMVQPESNIVGDIQHSAKPRRQKAWAYWLSATFAGLFLAGTLWFSATQYDVANHIQAGFDISVLLPQQQQEKSAKIQQVETITPQQVVAESQPETAIIAEETNPAPAATTNTYRIVVGAFRKQAGCARLKAEVEAKGFQCDVVGETGNGFMKVVILQNAATPEEALHTVKEAVNPSAWILK